MIKLNITAVTDTEMKNILHRHMNLILQDMFEEEITVYSFSFLKNPDKLKDDAEFGKYEKKCFRGIRNSLTDLQMAMYFMQANEVLHSDNIIDAPLVTKVICLNLARYFQHRYKDTVNNSVQHCDPHIIPDKQSYEFAVDKDGDLLVKRIKLFSPEQRQQMIKTLMDEQHLETELDAVSILNQYERIDQYYNMLRQSLSLDEKLQA